MVAGPTVFASGTLTAPLCATCTRPDPSFWQSCPTCGQDQFGTHPCPRCVLRARLREPLGGEVRGEPRGLYENLANSQRPNTMASWLNKSKASVVLAELGTGQRALTHAGLDEAPRRHPTDTIVITGPSRTAPRKRQTTAQAGGP